MPRGGARTNSGPRPSWKHGKTTTIRVPIVLADKLLEIARALDENEDFEVDTGSKREQAEQYSQEILFKLSTKKRSVIPQPFVAQYLESLINKLFPPGSD